MANSNYDEIFTTTLESRSAKLADNVTKNNALSYQYVDEPQKIENK